MEVSDFGRLGAYALTLMNGADDLIARARRGEDDAFRLVFEQHHHFIIRFLYAMVGEQELAEELTQETFLRAYKNLNGFRQEGKVSTWLCGIARNVALNSLRSRVRERRKTELEGRSAVTRGDGGSGPDELLLNEELRGVIHDALAELDEDKRTVFTLKVLQQQSYEEIARVTGHSIAKLKTDLHRAKAEMRRRIRPYLEVSK